jgi:cyanophycinase-like exopeptidase
MHAVLARGGVVGGSSAGATIQGELLVRGNPLGNTEMWCEGYDRGFSFVPGVAVDQHFVARDREADLTGLIARFPQFVGLGIDEGTAAIVRDHRLEVVGESLVAIVDARSGASVTTWLKPGDRWHLRLGKKQD